MTLDYRAKTMTFVPNGYNPPNVTEAMMAALLKGDELKILAPAAQWGLMCAKEEKDEDAGVTVTKVLAGSPVAEAGLKEGDRLLTLNGRWTDSVADTFTAAGFVKPGTTVSVVVKRGGKEQTLKVKPISGL